MVDHQVGNILAPSIGFLRVALAACCRNLCCVNFSCFALTSAILFVAESDLFSVFVVCLSSRNGVWFLTLSLPPLTIRLCDRSWLVLVFSSGVSDLAS